MGEKEEKDLYRNFSRKDLQQFCKKYDLPANKSNSEMATSLILYLEKKNTSSRAIQEVTRSDSYPSGLLELRTVVSMKSGDCRGMMSNKGHGNVEFCNNRYASQKNRVKSKGPAASNKVSDDIGSLTQSNRDRSSSFGIPETAFSSVVSSTADAPLPSFTFDVSSEDGIQLCVDLNSNTSDWVENMKAGVRVCSGSHNPEANSCHREAGQLGCSKHEEPNVGQHKDGSDQTTAITAVAPQADEPGGREVSLSSPKLKSFSFTVHNMEDAGEEHPVRSSRLEPHLDGQHRGPESVVIFDNIVASDPEKIVGTPTKISNISRVSMREDYKCTDSVNHVSREEVGFYNGPCKQQTCGVPDTVRHDRLSGAASMEIQASNCTLVQHQEVVSSFVRVGTNLALPVQPKNSDAAHLGLSNSKFYSGLHQMHPVQANGQNQYASSLFMGSRDNAGCKVDIGHGRAVCSKSNGEIPEARIQLDQSWKGAIPFIPFKSYVSVTSVNLTSGVETENVGVMSSHKACPKAVELPKNDVYLNPCSSGQSSDMAAPKQRSLDHYILNYSNDLEKDICQNQIRTKESLDVVNLTKSVEAEEATIISSHKAAEEFVDLRKIDASPRHGSFQSAFTMQNGVNHYILNFSNNLDKGICRGQARADVGLLGGSKTGNGVENTECSDLRNPMEKPLRKAYSERNENFKKRHFSSVENKSQSVSQKKSHFSIVESISQSLSPEASVLRTSKHFTGDARASRRRSSRLVTKGRMKLKGKSTN